MLNFRSIELALIPTLSHEQMLEDNDQGGLHGDYENYLDRFEESTKRANYADQADSATNVGFWKKLMEKDYEKNLQLARDKELMKQAHLGRGKRDRSQTQYFGQSQSQNYRPKPKHHEADVNELTNELKGLWSPNKDKRLTAPRFPGLAYLKDSFAENDEELYDEFVKEFKPDQCKEESCTEKSSRHFHCLVKGCPEFETNAVLESPWRHHNYHASDLLLRPINFEYCVKTGDFVCTHSIFTEDEKQTCGFVIGQNDENGPNPKLAFDFRDHYHFHNPPPGNNLMVQKPDELMPEVKRIDIYRIF